jgi:hypothetical protein
MPRHDKVKINRANWQIGGKNCSNIFVFTAFISFGLFNIFQFSLGTWGEVSSSGNIGG